MFDKEKAEIFSKSLDEFLQGTENRYRWHDLRKDPDDVPTHNNSVLIAIGWQDGDIEYYYTDCYIGDGWVCEHFLRLGKVIAWKEVEPFEEVKNE